MRIDELGEDRNSRAFLYYKKTNRGLVLEDSGSNSQGFTLKYRENHGRKVWDSSVKHTKLVED